MNLLYSTDRPEFLERVASLAGKTAYRVPEGARGTKQDQLPDAHAIAAALGFARRGAEDVGPDVAFCWILRCDSYRTNVIRILADQLQRSSKAPRSELVAAIGAAWDAMVWQKPTARPTNIPERAWDAIVLLACGILNNAAWDSLAEAERRYKGDV